jgi:GNAT superfamily N-acetyltransferase
MVPYRKSRFIAHGWRYFRRRGLKATVRTVINRFVYGFQKFVVYRTCLVGPPAADHVGDIVFRLATPADLDYLVEFERYGLGTSQRAHVKYDNDWLFVACHGDRIVATRRYGRNVPPGSLMSPVLRLEPSQVWSADAFCLPEYRNQGLNRHFGLFTMRFLASQGYTEEFGVIVATNIPSLRSVLHRGSQFVHFVSYSRILFYERLHVANDVPTELTGVTQLTPKLPIARASGGDGG